MMVLNRQGPPEIIPGSDDNPPDWVINDPDWPATEHEEKSFGIPSDVECDDEEDTRPGS